MLSENFTTTRRSFIKGAAALTAAIPLIANSKFAFAQPTPPSIDETEYRGTSPHNCGGRCVMKTYVKNGRITRITTDERPDRNIIDGFSADNDDPQRRACVRCRSKKEWYYRADRLTLPLKQTGERGDISTFQAISWEQAYKEMADKLKQIVGPNGEHGERLYFHYATGDGAAVPRARPLTQRMLEIIGGTQYFRDDYSYPSLEHVNAILTANSGSVSSNDRHDVMNADALVLWSWNGSETINDTNSSWYAVQFRDTPGKKVYGVDSRYAKSVAMLAKDGVFTPAAGTDPALISAMIYHMLDEHLKECARRGIDASQKSSWLNPEDIKKYTYGFFDTNPNKLEETHTYHDVSVADFNAQYGVRPGTSFSAYIFGDDRRLVNAGLNQNVSVYPNTIGYNVNGANWDGMGAPADPIFGRRTPIYGQLPKTPAWASRITGVSEQNIKKLAELYAKNKVTTWVAGGFQRTSESEQPVWMVMALSYITGNFGEPGRAAGVNTGRAGSPAGIAMPAIPKDMADRAAAAKARQRAKRYNESHISFPATVVPWLEKSYSGTCSGSFPVFLWQDAIEVAKTGRSRWNDGQIVKDLPIRALMNFGGNCLVNQCGDSHLSATIVKDRSCCELIITTDFFFTSSCLYSDYVLPASMAFEKTFVSTQGEVLLHSPNVLPQYGQCQSDYDICGGIMKAYGTREYNAYSDNGKSDREIVKAGIEKNIADGKYKNLFDTVNSYAELERSGIISGSTGSNINFRAFKTDPKANRRGTPSGRLEIYSQLMMEDYEARLHDNIDNSPENGGMLYNGGTLFSPKYNATNKARYVYPIPMYIPLPEGRQACDSMKGIKTLKDFPNFNFREAIKADPMEIMDTFNLRLHSWHMQYRSHSTLNSNAYLNEVYKRNAKGELVYIDPKRTAKPGMAVADVWEDGIYEPGYMNPETMKQLGLKKGLVKVTSPRSGQNGNGTAAIVVYLMESETIAPGDISIAQGAWMQLDSNGNDIGGNINTLFSIRPSRICKGMSLASDCRVKVTQM